jgi:uncharacterized protein YciI
MRLLASSALLFVAAGTALPSPAETPAPGSEARELRYIAFLRPDPARTPMSLEGRQHIMDEHMANIRKMADDGVLVAAGPMDDTPRTISGIFVLKAPSLAEAIRITALDPTVAQKRNTADVHPWWGPAGIGVAYFSWKKENPAAKDEMATHVLCIVMRGQNGGNGPRPDPEHAAYVDTLRAAGLLAAAGPFDGDPDLFGIVVFKASSLDAARKAMAQDPALLAGRIAVEYHEWWTADRVLPW